MKTYKVTLKRQGKIVDVISVVAYDWGDAEAIAEARLYANGVFQEGDLLETERETYT